MERSTKLKNQLKPEVSAVPQEPSPPREGWASATAAGNLQNLMAAIPRGISKPISLQGAPVRMLPCFHHPDSTPLPTACKERDRPPDFPARQQHAQCPWYHHPIPTSRKELVGKAPSQHCCQQFAQLWLQLGQTKRPEAEQNQHRKAIRTCLPLPCIQPPSWLAGIFCSFHTRARKQE